MSVLQRFKSKLFSGITEVPVVLRDNYYPALNGLRGVAILMVLFTHLGIDIIMPFNLRIESRTGVNMFFVLSGFLITTSLIKEKLKNGQISLKNFYIRRVLRIVPLLYLFLIILLILSRVYRPATSATDFIASFLFLKNLPIPNHPITASLWTLSVEEQFYLFLPLLIFFSINRYLTLALAVVILIPLISIIGFYAGTENLGTIFKYTVKTVMYLFWKGPVVILIGSAISVLTFKGIIKPGRFSGYYLLSFFLLITAVVISTQTFVFYSKYISEYASSIIIGFVVVMSIGSNSLLSAILSNQLLVKIGILSYSIYIWQQFFMGANVWVPAFRFVNSYPIWLIIVLKLAVLFPLAWLSYYFFESRFLRLKKRFT